MGAAKSKAVREAPVRYVAKKVTKEKFIPLEEQLGKPNYSLHGINKRLDDVNTQPLMYVETQTTEESTVLQENGTPRHIANTYMEMVDNTREDRVLLTGSLPASWERDKSEPYSLVRNRIDEEDLDYILKESARNRPIDAVLEECKLERQVLQDIWDTVELPRRQYRNYKGKLHKTVDNVHEHVAVRKKEIERSRERELLHTIGYSDEDMEKDDQYMTNRGRGVKTLDLLGVSVRHKERAEKLAEHNDMQTLLEKRKREEVEAGAVEKEDLDDQTMRERHTEHFTSGYRMRAPRQRAQPLHQMIANDLNQDPEVTKRVDWWLHRTRGVKRARENIHGAPVFNETLTRGDEIFSRNAHEAAQARDHEIKERMAKKQQQQGDADHPQDGEVLDFDGQLRVMNTILRDRQKAGLDGTSVVVNPEGDEMADHPSRKFPGRKHLPPAPEGPAEATGNTQGTPSAEGVKTFPNYLRNFQQPPKGAIPRNVQADKDDDDNGRK